RGGLRKSCADARKTPERSSPSAAMPNEPSAVSTAASPSRGRPSTSPPWFPPVAFTLAIYTTLPLVSGVRRWVKTRIGEWPIRDLATTLFVLTFAWALLQGVRGPRRRDPGFWSQATLLVVLDVLCLLTHRSEPIEQMHLFEYGLLAVLVLRA